MLLRWTAPTALALALQAGPTAPPTVPPLRTPAGLPERVASETADSDALAGLGARLFFDPLLSADRSVACASCHKPELNFADSSARSRGVREQLTERNSPSLLNRAYGARFMWDCPAQAIIPARSRRSTWARSSGRASASRGSD